MFVSVAALVKVNVLNSPIVCVEMFVSVGATFTSFTTTVNELVAVSLGLFVSKESRLVTTVVKVLVLGLWVCSGDQVMTPLALMLAPEGATSRL